PGFSRPARRADRSGEGHVRRAPIADSARGRCRGPGLRRRPQARADLEVPMNLLGGLSRACLAGVLVLAAAAARSFAPPGMSIARGTEATHNRVSPGGTEPDDARERWDVALVSASANAV